MESEDWYEFPNKPFLLVFAFHRRLVAEMETAKIFTLMFLVAFLVIKTGAQLLPPRPLCTSQFALVNYACAALPYSPLPPPSHPSPPSPDPDDGDDDDDDDNNDDDNLGNGHGHHHGHDHGNGHHHRRPHHHKHRHRHRHHHHHHGHHESPVERDCCRWLKEVDDECVCDLLVRLPPFLSKPAHEYVILVDDACNVTYSCGGRLKP